MPMNPKNSQPLSRRHFGKLVLAGIPASLALRDLKLSAWAEINSRIKGVQIGAITYSFRTMSDPADIIKAFVTIGLGEMELMSGDAEKLAGAPAPPRGGGPRGTPPTPEQVAARDAAAK